MDKYLIVNKLINLEKKVTQFACRYYKYIHFWKIFYVLYCIERRVGNLFLLGSS